MPEAAPAKQDDLLREVEDADRIMIPTWRGRRPVYEGYISVNRLGFAKTTPSWKARLSFDATTDVAPPWTEAGVALFANVSRTLGAFYGAAYLQRNVVLSRGTLFVQHADDLYISAWDGLPSFATWLTWFGEAYRDRLAGVLPSDKTTEYPDGLLVRMSKKPLNSDQLLTVFPSLPRRLTVTKKLVPKVINWDGTPTDELMEVEEGDTAVGMRPWPRRPFSPMPARATMRRIRADAAGRYPRVRGATGCRPQIVQR
jgi:hypothetical protein